MLFVLSPQIQLDEVKFWSLIAWHVPTLFTAVAFSFFAYFIAKLNLEVEKAGDHRIAKSKEATLPLLPKTNRKTKDQAISQHKRDNGKNILLPSFFLFFNLLALLTFTIIVFSCKSLTTNDCK